MPLKLKVSKNRKGFKNRPSVKEWSVEGDTFIWQESRATSIKYNQLPFSRPDPIEPPHDDEKEWIKSFKLKLRHRYKLSDEERYDTMKQSYYFSPKYFCRISPEVLSSKKWTDAEKLTFLISKLPFLCGFRYGKQIEAILSTVHWNSPSFRIRMREFYDTVRSYVIDNEDYEKELLLDEKTVGGFEDKVILYRGFLVPASESIRDRNTNNWLKQETGASVYFTTDRNVAAYFAVIQKYNSLMQILGLEAKEISKVAKDRVEAKISIAKYEVNIDDIILFDDYLGRKESECICLPKKTNLLNYEFLGFDDFVRILKARNPGKNK